MPLVLTTNDVVLNPDHAWNDVEGVQYHYPNQYRNKIRPGEEFVYYRGVHRKDGRRGQAEYFGRGRIGEVRPDPATQGVARPSWFCAIENYTPFNPPVPAKPDGQFYEQILPNMWRNGVRDLEASTYAAILAAAGSSAQNPIHLGLTLPQGPTEASDLIIPPRQAVGESRGGGGYRRSKRSKEIGDWAEDAALRFIRDALKGSNIVHRAGIHQTPGWDIDYRDAAGVLHRIEVKGTVGAAFTSIDLTIGELTAARAHGDGYWIFLVAGCLTDHPRIQRVQNPAQRIAANVWNAKPTLFNVALG